MTESEWVTTETDWLTHRSPLGLTRFVRRCRAARKKRLLCDALHTRVLRLLGDRAARPRGAAEIVESARLHVRSMAIHMLVHDVDRALALVRPGERDLVDAESSSLADLVREVFGNPFHPVVLSAEWLTTDVTLLARQMYKSGEFGAMPILADALQDAGCVNDAVLDHCRGTSLTHVRGCWVIDEILGHEGVDAPRTRSPSL